MIATARPPRAQVGTRRRPLPGQSTVEFSLIAVVLFGMLFAILDCSYVGFAQHTLDGAAYTLANAAAAISNTNSTPGHGYTPTALDPGGSAAAALAAAVASAARAAGSGVSSATLTPVGGAFSIGTTTMTNTSMTIVGTPNLTAPTEITASVTATISPIPGIFLRGVVWHISAHSSAIAAAGQ